MAYKELKKLFHENEQAYKAGYERLKPLKSAGLLIQEKVERKTYLKMDIDRLRELFG